MIRIGKESWYPALCITSFPRSDEGPGFAIGMPRADQAAVQDERNSHFGYTGMMAQSIDLEGHASLAAGSLSRAALSSIDRVEIRWRSD